MKPHKKFTPLKKWLIAIGIVLFVFVGTIVGVLFYYFGPGVFIPQKNYAEEVAKPLEEALVKAGGVKKCSTGDSGRGWDNDAPNYQSLFQFNKDKDSITKIISEVAVSHGFSLIHEDSPYGYIEWYADTTSKDNNYEDLDEGKVSVHFSTNNNSSKTNIGCFDGPSLLGDDEHTAVTFSVNLPSYKRANK